MIAGGCGVTGNDPEGEKRGVVAIDGSRAEPDRFVEAPGGSSTGLFSCSPFSAVVACFLTGLGRGPGGGGPGMSPPAFAILGGGPGGGLGTEAPTPGVDGRSRGG
mgnify:CR=1 FL=1